MGIPEPSGRLIRRRLPLSELTFDIVHEKRSLNTQANVVLKLQSLGHTTVPLDEAISTYPEDSRLYREKAALISDSDTSGHILITHEDMQDPPVVPITSMEMPGSNKTIVFAAT